MKKLVCILLTALLCLSLVACGSEPAATNEPAEEAAPAGRADKESIIIALSSEPTNFDAQKSSDDGNMRKVTNNIYESLVLLEGTTLEPQAVLAESWERLDENTIQFKLRSGVKFTDGSDFDAADVIYSVNRGLADDAQLLSSINTIKEVVAVDDLTVNVVTTLPDPILLTRLALVKIMPEGFAEANDVATTCCGTGPYVLGEWKAGDYITMTANENYWGEAPAIKNVKYRFIEEKLTSLSALQAGEIDLAVNMLPEYVEDLPAVFTAESNEMYWVRFNQLRTSIFSDVNARLAAEYAVDTQGIAEALFLGYATPAEGQLGRSAFTGYTDSIKNYGYDLEKAKELLAASGYDGSPIQLVGERGRWLKDGEVVETVAAQLTEAGFNVQTQFLSWNEWLDMLYDKDRCPDLFFSSNGNDFFDYDRPLATCASSLGNQSATLPSEWDDKITAAGSEVDEAARQALYDEINQHFYEDPYAIYLIGADALHGGQTDINWVPRLDGELLLATISYKSVLIELV